MLKFSRVTYEEMRRDVEQAYPQEACGVLLGPMGGEERMVREVIPCANAAGEEARRRYTIDPRELIAIHRKARERELEVIGFYHSHPDHEAQWSETDFAEAHWIGCSYLITEVREGRATTMRSFALIGHVEEDKAFVEEEVVLE